jgi:hypothetical protein
MEEIVCKVGFYTITLKKVGKKTTYVADNGKTVFSNRTKKYVINKNRDLKEFTTLAEAKTYASGKVKKYNTKKNKKIKALPKSLYLVLIKEEVSGKTFVKVGITSKRFIMRRFSKAYGYEGYVVEAILRRVDTPSAAQLEEKIKDALKKKRSVKKYRPLLENFSGYSECFNYDGLDEIVKVFDDFVKNAA